MRYLLKDISSVNGLKTLYIGIKTTELVENQAMFQRKIEDFKGK